MSEPCDFCGGPVNPHDESTYKQVTGWVHGRKRDSMTLREDTGKYAHTHCIVKAKAGQPIDQPDLFGEDPVPESIGEKMEGWQEPEDVGYMFETPDDALYPEPKPRESNHSLGVRDEDAF